MRTAIPLPLLACLAAAFLLTNCRTVRDPSAATPAALRDLMAGSYGNAMQADISEEHHRINLHLQAIWPDQPTPYLYVEQSVAGDEDRPYRQRVYRLGRKDRRTLTYDVYEIPEPARFVGAHKDPARLQTLTPADLIARPGCTVYLRQDKGGVWRGETRGKGCRSNLNGAAYSTSRVSVAGSLIQAWDRGFTADGTQVWGPTEGGYLFFPLGERLLDY